MSFVEIGQEGLSSSPFMEHQIDIKSITLQWQKMKRGNSSRLGQDNMIEEDGIDIDWDGMYENVRSEIPKLLGEGKIREVFEAIKRIREIPLDERVKIVYRKFEKIKKIKGKPEMETIKKYIKDGEEQKKCLDIFYDFKKRKATYNKNRKEYLTFNEENKKERLYPLLKATKQAIEANDLPSLITLLDGCLFPYNVSIYSPSTFVSYSLFEYSCKVYADNCALYFIKQKYSPESKLLRQAAKSGNEEIGMFLIERGADIKAVNKDGKTALHAASKGNCLEIAKLLIDKGADINALTKRKISPLCMAINNNSAEVAKMLIERGAIEIYNGANFTKMLLHEATFKNSVDVVIMLIEKGYNIEGKDIFGNTPLHNAAYFNCVEAAKLLIERGANIEAKDRDGKTPLHWAATSDSFEVGELLIEKGADVKTVKNDGENLLYSTAKKNYLKFANLLIEKGADIEAKNLSGSTPLHAAAFRNNVDVAELLIEKGADIEMKDQLLGRTPLHDAASQNCLEVAKLLIEKGADINASDGSGNTPLGVAVNNDSDEVAEFLRRSNVNKEKTPKC